MYFFLFSERYNIQCQGGMRKNSQTGIRKKKKKGEMRREEDEEDEKKELEKKSRKE